MSGPYYVYVLYDHVGTPRYVGVGCGRRWLRSGHRNDKSNPLKNAFILETTSKIGHVPVAKFAENLSREEAMTFERQLIADIGRIPDGPLLNVQPGGENNCTEERNAKISAALKGREIPPEQRAQIAATLTGRTQTRETVEKRRAKQVGKKRTPEQRARISAALKGKKKSPEHTAAIQAAAANRAPRQRGVPMSAETKAKMSEGQKRAWAENPTPRVERGEDGRFTS